MRRRTQITQDFDLEIQAGAAEAERLCGKALDALRAGGRLAGADAPRTIYDEEFSVYREVVAVSVRV